MEQEMQDSSLSSVADVTKERLTDILKSVCGGDESILMSVFFKENKEKQEKNGLLNPHKRCRL